MPFLHFNSQHITPHRLLSWLNGIYHLYTSIWLKFLYHFPFHLVLSAFFCVCMTRKINLININNGIIWMVGLKYVRPDMALLHESTAINFFFFCLLHFFWAEFYFNSINNWTLLIESEWNVFTFGADRYFHYFFRVDIVNNQSSVLLEERQHYSKSINDMLLCATCKFGLDPW